MYYPSAIEGFDVRRSAEEAKARLEAILSDKVMRFNPYLVSDEELLACAERGRWRGFPALTQMVVYHFGEIRPVVTARKFDALFYRVGNAPDEHYFPLGQLTGQISHHALRHQERVQVNGKNVTRAAVLNLQNRSFFVTHAIPGFYGMKTNAMAYKMFRLYGSPEKRAAMIRQQMCQSKIDMLLEVLHHPESPFYLGYYELDFDYVTPIRNAIAAISRYHLASQ